MNERLSSRLEDNIRELKRQLAVETNFDVLLREIEFGRERAALFFVDGLIDDQVMADVLRGLTRAEKDKLRISTFHKVLHRYINFTEVETANTYDEIVNQVLSGQLAFLTDGHDQAIMLDVRTYPARGPEEPDLEKVVRGSRDGFTETLVYNTALIRRRLRDPQLRIEILQAGTRSKTDIVVAYIADIANPDLVQSVKEKIRQVDIDGIPMAEKSLEELITPGSAWNPYPRVRYTERPDVTAAHLLEGHVAVLVDTSPSVMILPTTIFHHLQHAEEFRQNPVMGVFVRWVRFLGVGISLFILPAWLMVSLQPELLPPALRFIGPAEVGRIPLFLQFVLAELAIEMIRLSTIHTPSAIATALGIIAAVLVGDIAVQIGLFAPEVILYAVVAYIGQFLTPSQELGLANRLSRFFLLILVGLFGAGGFAAGVLIWFIYLYRTGSFGVPYLWPLLPFNWAALKTVLIRPPVALHHFRPEILKPRDRVHQPRPLATPARKPGGRGSASRRHHRERGGRKE